MRPHGHHRGGAQQEPAVASSTAHARKAERLLQAHVTATPGEAAAAVAHALLALYYQGEEAR